MLTPGGTTTATEPTRAVDQTSTVPTQKVVIVNGSTEMLDLLETVLDAGHYDVVFVESSERAYSQIKRVQPNLVILCVDLEEMDSFHVLSMLKLDQETDKIPVLTYTSDTETQDDEEDVAEPSDVEMFTARPAIVRMN